MTHDKPDWYVYIVQCADESLYTGITKDLDLRIKKHNLGQGAKYTRSRAPVKLVYHEMLVDKSAALKREIEIKKLTRIEKLGLLNDLN